MPTEVRDILRDVLVSTPGAYFDGPITRIPKT